MLRQVRSFASVGGKAKKAAAKRAGHAGHQGRSVDFSGELSGMEKRLTSLLRPVSPPPGKSEEEKVVLRAKMMKYGRFKRAQHIEMEVRMTDFMRAKWAAMDALPNYRRVEAMRLEPREYPKNRPLFTDTPPIKGFNSGDITRPS